MNLWSPCPPPPPTIPSPSPCTQVLLRMTVPCCRRKSPSLVLQVSSLAGEHTHTHLPVNTHAFTCHFCNECAMCSSHANATKDEIPITTRDNFFLFLVIFSHLPSTEMCLLINTTRFKSNANRKFCAITYCSSGSRNFGEEGPRNMKHNLLHSAAFFLWLFFTGEGGHGPLPPPLDPLLPFRKVIVVTFQWGCHWDGWR